MCTLALAYKMDSKYPLIFIGNRDEFYARPTLDAHLHDGIISGIDLEKGGTWTGITTTGKFACITNYRDFARHISEPKSRGLLLSEFFITDKSTESYLEAIANAKMEYNPFNLILGTLDDLRYYSNISDEVITLTPGIYGLSNALLDTPWPKVEQIKKDLTKTIVQNVENGFSNVTDFSEGLFRILENREVFSERDLPNTGISPELEKALSALFIALEAYGTRYETVILVNRLGKVYYFEKARQVDGTWHLKTLEIQIK
ncbi:NRDE family protein [Fusibacter bizertensis]